jgi:hypothetical protein
MAPDGGAGMGPAISVTLFADRMTDVNASSSRSRPSGPGTAMRTISGSPKLVQSRTTIP